MSKHNRERRAARRKATSNIVQILAAYGSGQSPNRKCGGCTECCHTFQIKAVQKPPDCDCEHQVRGTGCRVYENRPEECSSYACLWLIGWGTEEDRPDRSGVLLSLGPDSLNRPAGQDKKKLSIDVYEMKPGAMKRRFSSTGLPTHLLPDDDSVYFTLYSYKVPKGADGPFAPRYAAHVPPEGKNHLVSGYDKDGEEIVIQLGVIDRSGKVHTQHGVTEDSELRQVIRRLYDPAAERK